MHLITYFLQVIIYAGCFAIVYHLLLARSTNFTFSRLFLWCSTVLPLILPLMSLPILQKEAKNSVIGLLPEAIIKAGNKTITENLDKNQWVYIAYSLVVLVFLSLTIIRHLKFRRFLNTNHYEVIEGRKVYLNTGAGPGSYGRLVFIKDEIVSDAILQHELSHIRYRHYIDLIIMQLFKIVFWPNILLHFIASHLKLVHEYQADRSAANDNLHDYVTQLLSNVFKTNNLVITHQFFHHPIKNRIMMLQNSKIVKGQIFRNLVAAVLVVTISFFGLLCQVGCKREQAKPVEQVNDYVDEMPKFNGDVNQYLANHLKYPEDARAAGKEGRVGIKFVVDEDGSVKNVELVRSSGTMSLDHEALRVVSNMPNWIPGKKGGNIAAVYFNLPITFRLE